MYETSINLQGTKLLDPKQNKKVAKSQEYLTDVLNFNLQDVKSAWRSGRGEEQ